MVKIWVNEDADDDPIIALADDILYKCTPRAEDVELFVSALKTNDIPQQKTLGIPFSYIKEVRRQEGKKYIQIFFGNGSEEHLHIYNPATLTEIFEFLGAALPRTSPRTEKYTPMQAGKKPLIALAVVIALFAWTLFIASGMESGEQYDVENGHYNSFAGLVLLFAYFGVKRVVLIFTSLMVIAIVAFVQKARNPPVIHRIIVKR